VEKNNDEWVSMCKELWGDRWKSTLARTVGVSKRTAMRWATGQITITPAIIDKINATYETWRK